MYFFPCIVSAVCKQLPSSRGVYGVHIIYLEDVSMLVLLLKMYAYTESGHAHTAYIPNMAHKAITIPVPTLILS